MSRIRQNFHEDCEASINKQINMELYASYVYLSMVCVRHWKDPFKSDIKSDQDHRLKIDIRSHF
jgi:hypothetical protein